MQRVEGLLKGHDARYTTRGVRYYEGYYGIKSGLPWGLRVQGLED